MRARTFVMLGVMLGAACQGLPDASTSAPANTSEFAWPGADDAVTVDNAEALGTNVSGLVYDATTGVLWAARNDPSMLLRLVPSGGYWVSDPNAPWTGGRALRYTDNAGNPDAEGVTVTSAGATSGVYVAAERNNDASSVSRNSILRYDITQSGATLRATHEWQVGSSLPSSGANLGIEAISWIPDSMLVANGFVDENTGQSYRPSDYASHGSGVFFVGLESNGSVYAFALNHTTQTATRLASISTGLSAVMGMEYDYSTGWLWAMCDNGCDNRSVALGISTALVPGRFQPLRLYRPPGSLPNVNNEGFAITPAAQCVNGRRAAFWVDDSNTGGHVLRRASLDCSPALIR